MILQGFVLLVGFFFLVKGADWFVEGAAGLAQRFQIPQLVIGLTIVAMGTSMPEAAVSITAALEHTPGIAIGNVVGSNVLNILLILGLTAWMRPLSIQDSTRRIEIPFLIAVTLALLLFGLTGQAVERWEGGVFWLLFLAYCAYLFRMSKAQSEQEEAPAPLSLPKTLARILLGGVLVVKGSDLAVSGASGIAAAFGISQRMIGLTIVALGTSLPELVTSVTAARKGNADIAVGNIVGSNIFNILFVLGTTALIRDVPFEPKFLIDTAVAIVSGLLLAGAAARGSLSKKWGLLMLGFYGAYFLYLCV